MLLELRLWGLQPVKLAHDLLLDHLLKLKILLRERLWSLLLLLLMENVVHYIEHLLLNLLF